MSQTATDAATATVSVADGSDSTDRAGGAHLAPPGASEARLPEHSAEHPAERSDSDLEGLSPEAYCYRPSAPGANRSRQPSYASIAAAPDAARHVHQLLAEGADASGRSGGKQWTGPTAEIWKIVPRGQGDGAVDGEDEPLTNLQAEVISYLTFQDAESSDTDTGTTAKKVMASAAKELVESIRHLQESTNSAKSSSLLGTVSRILSLPGASKAPRSAPPSPKMVRTSPRMDRTDSDQSDPVEDNPNRLSARDEATMSSLLAGLQNKVFNDRGSKVRAEEHRKACREDLERSSEKAELKKKQEAFLGFAGGVKPPSMRDIADDAQLSPEQKIDCLVQGFGPSEDPDLIRAIGPEQYFGDHVGVVVAEFGLVGYFAVTNHRICFIAYIPSPAQLAIQDARNSAKGEDAAAAPDLSEQLAGHLLMQSGSAVQHRRIAGVPAPPLDRRVWLQLRSEGLFVFASSEVEALYEPLVVFRFQEIHSLEPVYHEDHANYLSFSLKKPNGTKGELIEFEFGTRVGALNWRRELRTAFYRACFSSKLVRLSIPLVQITQVLQHSTSHNVLLDIEFPPDQLRVYIDGQQTNSDEAQLGMVEALISKHSRRLRIAVLDYSPTLSWRMARFEEALRNIASKELPRNKLGPAAQMRLLIDGGETVTQVAQLGHHIDTSTPHKAPAKPISDQHDVDSFVRELALDPKCIKAIYHAQQWKTKPTRGSLCISSDYICFLREHMVTEDYRIRIPVTHLNGASEGKRILTFPTLAVEVKGHDDYIFLFSSSHERDRALEQTNEVVKEIQQRLKDAVSSKDLCFAGLVQPMLPSSTVNYIPKTINTDKSFSPRIPPRRICIPVIGSRGDVQPLIALGISLQKHRHTVRIVSHPEYEDWVRGYGLEFAGAGGDPGALMALSVEHRLFSPAFFRESVSKFRSWLDNLLREVYEGCYDADAILEAPQTMAGIHVAERLGVPYFRIFTMPWTKTAAYPQAFSVPPVDLGTHYNLMSYSVFDQVFWAASQGQINRWRKNMLGLQSTDLSELDTASVPFIYNFSPAVVPVPTDWDDNICVSGYWFLETQKTEWEPPKDLVAFLEEGRKQGKKLAYCGFGSIVVDDPDGMTRNMYAAVEKAGIYAVIAKGWSSRMAKDKEEHQEIPVPKCCYVVDSIPHDWLFPQIDIALHHGGAGTTGASLRACLVTAIKPFFGDQFFWAQRVQKLGAGLRVASLSTSDLTSALKKAAEDRIMREKARQVGASILTENGPAKAIEFLYGNFERARRHPRFRNDLHVLHGDKLVFYPEPDEEDFVEADVSEINVDADRSSRKSHDDDYSSSEVGSENASTDGDVSDKSLRRRSKPTRLLKKLGHKLSLSHDDTDTKSISSAKSQSSPEKHKSSSPVLPRIPSLPDIPILDGLPKLSLTSAFRGMLDTIKEEDAAEERRGQSKRDSRSSELESQAHARQLLPRQIEVRLAHRLAEHAHNLHLQEQPPL